VKIRSDQAFALNLIYSQLRGSLTSHYPEQRCNPGHRASSLITFKTNRTFLSLFDFFLVANQNTGFNSVPVMKSISQTIPVIYTRCTFTLFRPFPVSERLEFIYPDFIKIIPVNITLRKRPVNIRAGGNGPVNQDRSDIDPRPAEKKVVPDQWFILTDISLTTEFHINLLFLAL
jgi:hypothetical protein